MGYAICESVIQEKLDMQSTQLNLQAEKIIADRKYWNVVPQYKS